MTWVFRDRLGISIFVYLDDIFIFSDTLEQHEDDLAYVLRRLTEEQLYIARHKLDVYSERMDCLGHVVDAKGLHADLDKMSKIRDWQTPRSYKEVERFLGLVQYLQNFMPDVSAYTAPLAGLCANGRPFVWREYHEKCLDSIKAIACKAPILHPIDPKSGEPIWVIADASTSGIGAYLGQGPNWETCRPAGFMSKKFTTAQRSYFTYEQETLALLEALLKWEDKLLGHPINLVTDHKSLEFFKKKDHRANRQIRWSQYFERFDCVITYVEGPRNKVADCLSRYYAEDAFDDLRSPDEYMSADIRLDPEGDDLPAERFVEIRNAALRRTERISRPSWRVQNADTGSDPAIEPRRKESKMLADHREPTEVPLEADALTPPPENPLVIASGPVGPDLHSSVDAYARSLGGTVGSGARNIAASSAQASEPKSKRGHSQPPMSRSVSVAHTHVPGNEDPTFVASLAAGYASDTFFMKIMEQPDHYSNLFTVVDDGLLLTKNHAGEQVICVPSSFFKGRRAREIIIDHAHTILGHKASQRTAEYVRRSYWWPKMGRDIAKYCDTCGICAATKVSTQRPPGLLHGLPIPAYPWESVAMDFVGPFPLSKGSDYLWVVTCRLTSLCHLIPITTTTRASELAWLFLKEIVRLHGTPKSIVSDRDPKFTSAFWKEVHKLAGTRLLMSTAFHPQTDGVSERKIRDVSAVLRTVVKSSQQDWAEKVPMCEFALNSSISTSTKWAPFELTYGHLPVISTILPRLADHPGVKEYARRAREGLYLAYDALIESRVAQTTQANKARRPEPKIAVGDQVYLSTSNLSLPKGRATRLNPRYVGPYRVLEADPKVSRYRLELPAALAARNIHPVFHASLLRPYHPNDPDLFPRRDSQHEYDFGLPDDREWLVEEITKHVWEGRGKNTIRFFIKWVASDEITKEPLETVEDLEALDRYLDLQGVQEWNELPR
jgi:hypothetical protein